MSPVTLGPRATVAAGALIIPVVAELIWPSFGDSGHLVFAICQLIGWVLVASVIVDVDRLFPSLSTTRGGRVGRRVLLTGCALQVMFALAYGISAAVSGEPNGASFVLFLAGFLAQLVGGIIWWRAMRSEPTLRWTRLGALATAGLGFLAMAVGSDPFHDIFLLSSYAGWAAVGVSAAAAAARRVTTISLQQRPVP
jgi:hypothetical protein